MAFVAGQILTTAELNALDINSLTVDTDTLVVDATNDRVGINKASPLSSLHVGGGAIIDDDLTVSQDLTAGSATITGNTTSPGFFRAQSSGADGGIVLGQAFSSSYVGLRTANMSASSGDEYNLITDGNNTFISAGTTGDVYIRGGGNDSACQVLLDTSANNILMTGNVGIGGVTPPAGSHLQVASQNRAVSVLDSGDNNYAELGFTSASSDGPAYGYLSGYGLFLRTGTSRSGLANRMYIDSSGNVGMGTTSPDALLDVNGNLTVRGGSFHLRGTHSSYPNAINFHTSGAEGYFWHMSAPREAESHSWKLYWYNGSSYLQALEVTTGRDLNVGNALTAPTVNATTVNLNTSVHLTNVDADGSMRVQGNNGYIDIGPKNSTYCHIYTDRGKFYLNQGINSAPYFY